MKHPSHEGAGADVVPDVAGERPTSDGFAEEAETLDRLFRVANDLVCVASRDGRLLRVSDSWERVLGWRPEELEGEPYLALVHPDDRAATERLAAQVARDGSVVRFRNRYRTRDGGWRWLEWSATTDDRRHNALAIARDVTEGVQREQERERLLAGLRRFVPQRLLDILGHDDIASVRLGDGVRRDVTVLFADVHKFATLSEGLTARETFRFIAALLGGLAPVVRERGGWIDKYIGDAIMAVFPGPVEDAIEAAVEMQRRVRRLSEHRDVRHPVRIGVGVHVGAAIMGIVGEPERLEGTVISDAVNVASRLERRTRDCACDILVSGDVVAALSAPDEVLHRPIGPIRLDGRADPVLAHEVFAADPIDVQTCKRRTRPAMERAAAALVRGDRAAARAALRLAAEAACGPDPVIEARLAELGD